MGRERGIVTKDEKEGIKEWLLEYDNKGFMPIHCAIDRDNHEYIKAMNKNLENLGIEIKEEEIKAKDEEGLMEYIDKREVTPKTKREIKDLLDDADKRGLKSKIDFLMKKIERS